MKLVRFLDEGKNKSGILEDKHITEISCPILEAFNESEKISQHGTLDINDVKLLPPVSPSKIVCVGLNYKDHLKSSNIIMIHNTKKWVRYWILNPYVRI